MAEDETLGDLWEDASTEDLVRFASMVRDHLIEMLIISGLISEDVAESLCSDLVSVKKVKTGDVRSFDIGMGIDEDVLPPGVYEKLLRRAVCEKDVN